MDRSIFTRMLLQSVHSLVRFRGEALPELVAEFAFVTGSSILLLRQDPLPHTINDFETFFQFLEASHRIRSLVLLRCRKQQLLKSYSGNAGPCPNTGAVRPRLVRPPLSCSRLPRSAFSSQATHFFLLPLVGSTIHGQWLTKSVLLCMECRVRGVITPTISSWNTGRLFVPLRENVAIATSQPLRPMPGNESRSLRSAVFTALARGD